MKPTRAQIAKWNRLKKRAKALNMLSTALYHTVVNAKIAHDFAAERNINLGFAPLFERAKQLADLDARFQKIIQAVELEKLGLRFRPDGDIDILAPPDMTDDEIAQYMLSGELGWIFIVVGIVVAAAALAWAADIDDRFNNLIDEHNDLLDDTDKKFCADPNSEICLAWLKRKEEKEYHKREGIVESLRQAASKLGGAVVTGTHWGLMIAIPLVAYLLFGKKRG